jgi:DNA-binding response OmpR family regulator
VSGGRHVFLVDDDAALAELYRFGLETEGFRVTVLTDALDLNVRVAEDRPDIVVLDWELPGMRGDEALERLRRTSHGSETPVFMFSNFSGTHDGTVDRAFASGAIAWLEKRSTTPPQLAAKLLEVLETSPKPVGDKPPQPPASRTS